MGQVWYLIVSIPDIAPLITLYQAICIVCRILFMILLENIVVQQRSNFIQFIHISLKDPRVISSDHYILPTLIKIGICFGVRVLVMIPLMFVHYTLSSVWVAEWPPIEK